MTGCCVALPQAPPHPLLQPLLQPLLGRSSVRSGGDSGPHPVPGSSLAAGSCHTGSDVAGHSPDEELASPAPEELTSLVGARAESWLPGAADVALAGEPSLNRERYRERSELSRSLTLPRGLAERRNGG